MSSVVDWSEINPELIDLIMKRLDLVEFIRAGAVCQSWWLTMNSSSYISPPKSHTPWLILSSPHQPEFRYVGNPAADSKSLYKFNLPDVKYHFIVGSSHGFIISVDEIGQIRATNPITGSHRLLPAITTLQCCDGPVRVHHVNERFFHKVSLFPTSSAGLISVFMHNRFRDLAFARQSDESWTFIYSPMKFLEDVLFYKGLLYAVNFRKGLIAFDILNFSASSQPVVYQEEWKGNSSTHAHKYLYLVQSPCGSDLFLIERIHEPMTHLDDDGDIAHQTVGFKTYKLNQDSYEWSEVSSFGTDPVIVFLGFNPSVMLLAKDIPNIAVNKGDCIYFTDDYHLSSALPKKQKLLDMGIFYMEENKIVPLDIAKDDPQQFNYPPPFWFTPVNK